MTYNFIYEPEYYRIIPAVCIDSRATIPAIKNQVGSVIKIYCDNQVAVINGQSIVYKIETQLGVLVGFFTIQVSVKNKTATLIMKQFRPAFMQFSAQLSLQIGNFIQSNSWKADYLF